MAATEAATTTPSALLALPTEALLEVLSFLNAVDLGRAARACRLLCVLAWQQQQHAPAFTAVHGPVDTLAGRARERLPTAPNVGFFFPHAACQASTITAALQQLPPGLSVIGGKASYPLLACDEEVIHDRDVGRGAGVLSLVSLPGVRVQTFMPKARDLAVAAGAPPTAASRSFLREHFLGLDPAHDWKVVILLTTGEPDDVDRVIQAIADRYPRAAVIGGVCNGVFCWRDGRLQTDRDTGAGSIVGMALAGNVPVQAIVSRGVSPKSPPLPVVDWEYDDAAQLLVVRSLRVNREQPQASPRAAASGGDIVCPVTALYMYDLAGSGDLYVGYRDEVPQQQQQQQEAATAAAAAAATAAAAPTAAAGQPKPPAFSLLSFDFAQEGDHTILLLSCKAKPAPGSRLSLKFFELESEACRAHVERKMQAVGGELQGRNQELLGALLFSCNGRGPRRFLDLLASGVDARAFTRVFPRTPVAGFYAMGEVGPQAIYLEDEDDGEDGEDASLGGMLARHQPGRRGGVLATGAEEPERFVLANSQTGSCALQGFTAVYGLFIVPRRSHRGSPLLERLHREGTAAALAYVRSNNGGGEGGTQGAATA